MTPIKSLLKLSVIDFLIADSAEKVQSGRSAGYAGILSENEGSNMSEYSPYRRPSLPVPEKQEKLDKSADEASCLTLREIRCPRCNFPIMKVYSDAVGHVRPKCPKCKAQDPINLAYFRKQKGIARLKGKYY